MENLIGRIGALLPEVNRRRVRTVIEALAAGTPIEQIKVPRETINDIIMCGRFIAMHQFAAASVRGRGGTRITIEGSSEELLRLLRQLVEQKQQADA